MSYFLTLHPSSLNVRFYLSVSCFTTLTNLFPTTTSSQNQLNITKQTQKHLISLIKSCSKKTHFLQIHAHIILTSLIQDPTISLHLLSRISFSPFRETRYSRQIFDQIPNPNVSHFNTIIRAYSISNSPEQAFYLFKNMRKKSVPTSPLTCSFAIKSCIRFCSLIGGVQIHARILRDGYQSDSLLMTTLMDFYSNRGKSVQACRVFDEISQRDTVAWNVLISCYIRNQRTRDALCLFDNMNSEENECKPDDVTCLLVLHACAQLGALEFGEKVHSFIEEHGYGDAKNVCNSLIAMYSRCGSLDKAYWVFKGIREKNVVSWSAMIHGFAINGHGKRGY
ncbi:hypothetical protein Patl1_18764 [Pistacia atlantica]|uniref:Uncharacterized protein n=1 Tax=Pistacia atlantica TaxID=434234 RepID=A0ACC1C0N5_9ROSI|nr:hypothetical protein Patl1_18764 [Pistacia atlantica]